MHTLQLITIALVCVSATYTVLSAVAIWRFARLNPQSSNINPQSPFTPPVTILKPVCGLDAEAEENFRSFIKQDYPDFQVIFGALDHDDPALVVALKLATKFDERDIRITSNPRIIGANLKVANLINMMDHAKHDLLIIADSDMRVNHDYLRAVIAPFADERVGLVTCPYRGVMPREATRWQRIVIALHALGINADFMPSVMVAHLLGMRGFAFGSTIAIRRRVLDELGGLARLKDHLADDYWLGQFVQHAGHKVVLSRYVVDNVLSPESFGEMFARRLRWARTVKLCQPVGYLGSFVTHLVPLAVANAIARGLHPDAWATVVGAVLLRMVSHLVRGAGRDLWLLPMNDLLSFVVFLLSLLPGQIVWRGQKFRVTKDGVLDAIPTPPPSGASRT